MKKKHSVKMLASVIFIFLFLNVLFAAEESYMMWEKKEVVPVVIVKPGVGGFIPVEGKSANIKWGKNEVRPIVILTPDSKDMDLFKA